MHVYMYTSSPDEAAPTGGVCTVAGTSARMKFAEPIIYMNIYIYIYIVICTCTGASSTKDTNERRLHCPAHAVCVNTPAAPGQTSASRARHTSAPLHIPGHVGTFRCTSTPRHTSGTLDTLQNISTPLDVAQTWLLWLVTALGGFPQPKHNQGTHSKSAT